MEGKHSFVNGRCVCCGGDMFGILCDLQDQLQASENSRKEAENDSYCWQVEYNKVCEQKKQIQAEAAVSKDHIQNLLWLIEEGDQCKELDDGSYLGNAVSPTAFDVMEAQEYLKSSTAGTALLQRLTLAEDVAEAAVEREQANTQQFFQADKKYRESVAKYRQQKEGE